MTGLYVPARLYDARGVLVVPDDHPLAPLRFKRQCRVRELRMAVERGICSWCRAGEPIGPRRKYHPACREEVRLRTTNDEEESEES